MGSTIAINHIYPKTIVRINAVVNNNRGIIVIEINCIIDILEGIVFNAGTIYSYTAVSLQKDTGSSTILKSIESNEGSMNPLVTV